LTFVSYCFLVYHHQIFHGRPDADPESVCREAGMPALRENALTVTKRHVKEAQKKVHPMMNENLRD